eukprot:COSAG01_NODE_956_length_12480_cov_109.564090_10_plen_232_part_00
MAIAVKVKGVVNSADNNQAHIVTDDLKTSYTILNPNAPEDYYPPCVEWVNISCRVKSLKGMICRPQRADFMNSHLKYGISSYTPLGINQAQFRIGSVLYPQEPIKFDQNNKGELFQEIRKCFGTIGSVNHGTMLNTFTITQEADERVGNGGAAFATTGTGRQHFMIAYDFETFAKSATESGLNVSDRALPVNLTLKKSGLPNQMQAGRLDTWAMCDCIIYIDLMGRITTRI